MSPQHSNVKRVLQADGVDAVFALEELFVFGGSEVKSPRAMSGRVSSPHRLPVMCLRHQHHKNEDGVSKM